MQKISSSENLEYLNTVLIVYSQSTFNIQSNWAIKTHIKQTESRNLITFYDLKSQRTSPPSRDREERRQLGVEKSTKIVSTSS